VSNLPTRRKPGLKAVYEGREQRLRGKFTRLTPRLGLFLLSSFLLIIVVYGVFSKRSLDKAKSELLAKQRAVEKTLGPEWFPLRDRLEKLTIETAREWPGDWIGPEASHAEFRTQPTIYLRLRVNEAKDVETLREQARNSVKDGFAGCLFRSNASVVTSPDGGAAVAVTQSNAAEIASRGLADVWNLRQAYAATRVLTEPWVAEVKASPDDLRLRVFIQQFDKATREEIPLAVNIVKRAQFFLLVLDEDSAAAVDEVDGGAITMEALQLVPHDARVRLWNLKSGAEIARLKRRGEAGLRFVGEQPTADRESLNAAQRQVNNCALANRIKEAIGLK
jgi:hypothetical protein